MKINKDIYKVFFILSIAFQLLNNSFEFLYVFLFCSVGLLILDNRKSSVSYSLFNTISILSFILLIGLINGLLRDYEMFDILKDFLHGSKPILLFILGFYLAKRIEDSSFVLKWILYLGVFFALRHIFIILTAGLENNTIEEIRRVAGLGNFIEIISIILLITSKRIENLRIKTNTKYIFLLVLSISLLLYFSRTMLLGMGIFLLSVYGFTRVKRKVVEYGVLFLIILGLFYAYLFTLNLDSSKPGSQSFFYKIRNAPAEVFSPPPSYNPNDLKEIFHQWRAYESKITLTQMSDSHMNYVLGKGYGSLIDLKFKAPIGGEDGLRYIPHIHNGYVYVFFKTGILGLLLYFVLLVNIYRNIYKKTESENHKLMIQIVSGFGVYYFFTSLIITGIYNMSEISFFCLGVFLYLMNFTKLKEKMK